jgi:hypothetical protein
MLASISSNLKKVIDAREQFKKVIDAREQFKKVMHDVPEMIHIIILKNLKKKEI